MIKKYAFTMIEILVVLVIIGVLSVVMLTNTKSENFKEKQIEASAYKVIEEFSQAANKIKESEPVQCPIGTFTAKIEASTGVSASESFALYDSTGAAAASAANVRDLFLKYIKAETIDNFCTNSGISSVASSCTDTNVKGMRVAGDIYVGFEVITVANCPSYRRIGEEANTSGSGNCWGKMYIDVNGKENPNTLGKDVYVLGLNGTGIAY